ncbi:UDP-N-acetylmuramoyl-L-alanyl-D-glutamate--2,6-diaminopimelate ligase [Pleionea sediminis]|uniref:UDP-N-acetylmuramoyl-L-alanyl-D-glutamate--2, 6-diaminopimelate ligase n=1 Tax=Pleionea sediminis TaxID=2569479 RepID=UPI0011861A3E|nr:UDP-N-acetylmuramoyl-L-alanyl-D-glutamate--2,6-diaminopimelate ligase [Pleionea sediminis]
MDKIFDFDSISEKYKDAKLLCGEKVLKVNDWTVDSRKVTKDVGFVACVGHQLDGRQFIHDAVANGACIVICEANDLSETVACDLAQLSITVVLIHDLNQRLSALASLFYDNPSEKLNVIGVTGTNGKSSCVQMLAQTIQTIDKCCWTMGTLGCGAYGAQVSNENTTADAITIQKELNKAVESGCGNSAMEVSSHGLVQGRIDAVSFDIAVFTNLTHEHLDYHETMDAYGLAKRRLFLFENLKWVVINVDDKFGRKLKKDIEIKARKIFVSAKQPSEGADLSQWVWVENIQLNQKGIQADVFTPWGEGKIKVPLVGRFNINNILSVVAVLGIKLGNVQKVLEAVNQVTSVAGRMQFIREKGQPSIIVDYAHTPDALEQALLAIRDHCTGKIITVFGCGGDRDPAKRPIMAKVAEKYSNAVLFTDDNPRTEDPYSIIEQMRTGLKSPDRVTYIQDRKEAIVEASKLASSDDIILVAGKGHEDYQIIGTKKFHLSDVELAREVLKERAA